MVGIAKMAFNFCVDCRSGTRRAEPEVASAAYAGGSGARKPSGRVFATRPARFATQYLAETVRFARVVAESSSRTSQFRLGLTICLGFRLVFVQGFAVASVGLAETTRSA